MRLRGKARDDVHKERDKARHKIVELARGYKGNMSATRLSLRTISTCVRVVRQHDKKGKHAATLAAAGFNPRQRRNSQRRLPRY
jgi:hypothetical protein